MEILPPDSKRAEQYRNLNWYPLKTLLPDGSVVAYTVVATESLAFVLDESHSPYIYIGEAVPGSIETDPVWRIQRLDTSSGIKITWALGKADFVNKWSYHLTLVYS